MEDLRSYLAHVVANSRAEACRTIPAGSFSGLFDERPLKRLKAALASAQHSDKSTTMFKYVYSDTKTSAVELDTATNIEEERLSDIASRLTKLASLAIAAAAVPKATQVLAVIIDHIKQLHDNGPTLDAAFAALRNIYEGLQKGYCPNGKPPFSMGIFEEEYRLLALLFDAKRPRTWIKTMDLIIYLTELAFQQRRRRQQRQQQQQQGKASYRGGQYLDGTGGILPHPGRTATDGGKPETLESPPLSEQTCIYMVEKAWTTLLASFNWQHSDRGSQRSGIWQPVLESMLQLLDCYLGKGPTHHGEYLLSHFALAKALDPGIAVSESGVLSLEMQTIVDLCVGRKRRLGRILFPPDASWPLVSHASRAHTEKHIYDRVEYSCVRETLTWEEIKRGPSADKYVADLLFQRASMDEIVKVTYSHSTIKKEVVEAAIKSSHIGLPGSTSLSQPSQSASIVNFDLLPMNDKQMVSKVILEALVKKTATIIEYIRSVCEFKVPAQRSDKLTMVVPKDVKYWELMNELADQLYSLVLNGYTTYHDVHREFMELSFPKNWDIVPPYTPKKDNSYIWLLLQLISASDCATNKLFNDDLKGDEQLLGDLFEMYNEQQTNSRDAFYVRDLSLSSIIQIYRGQLQDPLALKYRHANFNAVRWCTGTGQSLIKQIDGFFEQKPLPLTNGSLEEAMVISFYSQSCMTKVVLDLYAFLVPPHQYEVASLPNPGATYLKGGKLGYLTLDYLTTHCKNNFLKLIYKDMLDHEAGLRFQGKSEGEHDKLKSVNCVSPYVIDTVYRLLYTAPYTNELMMKEVLEKLRRCDQAMATQAENLLFSDPVNRWLYTVYQLMNCRLLRFFKYYAHASHLIHHLRHSLVHIKHPQLYRSLECFALCLMNLQHEVEFLQALLNPEYHGIPLDQAPLPTSRNPKLPVKYCKPKDPWFECDMLSRNAVMVITRIILMRGLGDVNQLSPADFLESLSSAAMHWSPASLRYFPPCIRQYYNSVKGRPLAYPSYQAIRSDIMSAVASLAETTNVSFNSALINPDAKLEDLTMVVSYYSQPDNQSTFLCVLWEAFKTPIVKQEKYLLHALTVARRILLNFPFAHMANYTSTLIDYIISEFEGGNGDSPVATKVDGVTKALLDDFAWKYQIIRHEHILYSLTRGEHDLRMDDIRVDLIRYIILESPPFVDRLNEWHSLNFLGRYWTDHDHQAKQDAFLGKFPESFEYEAYLVAKNVPLQPPRSLSLPAYYENGMGRLLPVLEFSLGKLIEGERRDHLVDICDRMGILFRLHQVPLTTLMNTLFVYFDSPTIHDARTMRSMILSLLDMTQQGFTPQFEQFVFNKVNDESHIDESYIIRILERVTRVISHKIDRPVKPNLPETHYREIPNPVLHCLTEVVTEMLTWWCLSRARDPASRLPPGRLMVATEAEIEAEERARRAHGRSWPLGRLWLGLVLDPLGRVAREGSCDPISYLHATGLFASVLPDELMTFPYIRHLAEIVTKEEMLGVTSGPKSFFSFVNLARTHYDPGRRAASTMFTSSDAFDSFERNLVRGTTNVPNTYLVLLHSVLHYGGIAAFEELASTIHALATEQRVTTDVQLLYICATVGPILYRLATYNDLLTQILLDIFYMLGTVLPNLRIDDEISTDALEQVIDFLYFVKHEFDPGRLLWSNVFKALPAFPLALSRRFYGLVCSDSDGRPRSSSSSL